MNPSIERHLAKAQGYLDKGEEFYLKAAEEMELAREEGATIVQIADALDRSESWVKDILRWAKTPANEGRRVTPWGGKEHADNRAAAHTKRILRDAPLEQVEQIISELPRERQKAIGAVAGHEYLKARTDLEDEERNRTLADQKRRLAAAGALADQARHAAGGFAALGIAGHMEQALEELQELDSFTAESLRPILDAYAALGQELQVKAAMVDLELDLQEVS